MTLGLPPGEAAGSGRHAQAGADRVEARPNELGDLGRTVKRQCDDGGRDLPAEVEQRLLGEAGQDTGENEVNEEELHEQRDIPEYFAITGSNDAEWTKGGSSQESDADPRYQRQYPGDCCDLKSQKQCFKQRSAIRRLPKNRPVDH